MRIIANPTQGRRVVRVLADAFARGNGLLAEKSDLVENQVPDGASPGSAEHATFLFFVVCHDHGVRSRDLYRRAKVAYSERPWLFSAPDVIERFAGPDDAGLVEATVSNIGVRYPREGARRWYLNALRLLLEYDGRADRLFRSTSDATDLLKKICSFRGYGPKTGGMLLRAAVGLGLAQVDRQQEVLVPVDIHDARIASYTGILTTSPAPADEAAFRAYVPLVQRALRDSCREARVSWLDVDRALWLIGSRGCVLRRCSECPLLDLCSVGSRQRAIDGVEMPRLAADPAASLPRAGGQ
jgi:endonuclease III